MPYCIWLRGSHFQCGKCEGRRSQSSVARTPSLALPPRWARKQALHLSCIALPTIPCILRYPKRNTLPIQHAKVQSSIASLPTSHQDRAPRRPPCGILSPFRLNAQPRLRILSGSGSAGGVCFLEASPRRSRRPDSIPSLSVRSGQVRSSRNYLCRRSFCRSQT